MHPGKAEGGTWAEVRNTRREKTRTDALALETRQHLHAPQNDNLGVRAKAYCTCQFCTVIGNENGISLAHATVIAARQVERSDLRKQTAGSKLNAYHELRLCSPTRWPASNSSPAIPP